MQREGLSYPMLAHHNGFTFVHGAFAGLDAGRPNTAPVKLQ